jgi:DNA-binding CsgD family transcriptional regulator
MKALGFETASGLALLRRGKEERGSSALEQLRAGATPAVASDMSGHVVMWNPGAEKLMGRSASQALGRRCHDLLAGRDVFGNRFCHEDCAVRVMCRKGEAVQGFELVLDSGRPPVAVHVSIVRLPGSRPDLDTVVHLLEPIDQTGRLARELERLAAVPAGVASRLEARAASEAPLSRREHDVLEWMAQGLQNKEIAQRLEISLATVRNHVHNLLEKLGVHSKLEAISLAYRKGWVRGEPPVEAPATVRAGRIV